MVRCVEEGRKEEIEWGQPTAGKRGDHPAPPLRAHLGRRRKAPDDSVEKFQRKSTKPPPEGKGEKSPGLPSSEPEIKFRRAEGDGSGGTGKCRHSTRDCSADKTMKAKKGDQN